METTRADWARRAKERGRRLAARHRAGDPARATIRQSDLPDEIPHRWYAQRIERAVAEEEGLRAGTFLGGYSSTVVVYDEDMSVRDHLEEVQGQ